MNRIKTSSCILSAMLIWTAGCATQKRPAFPNEQQTLGTIEGFSPDIRIWGDRTHDDVAEAAALIHQQVAAHDPAAFHKPQSFLALSGGGQQGAFGAGLLVGWSAHGSRPEFRIVTGISTGALMAPFAFLGSEYDNLLKKVYTLHSSRDIFRIRPVKGALWGQSMASSKPLFKLIANYADDELIGAIAREHRNGRRLYIATTHLDALRPVVWDIGKIAESDAPNKGDLIHRIILASSAIPGALPPVVFEVEKEGVRYNEVHVDGGFFYQLFLNPSAIRFRDFMEQAGFESDGSVYAIRNALSITNWQPVKLYTASIAMAAMDALTIQQGNSDQYIIYQQALLEGIDFHSARIPPEFIEKSKGEFDKDYMIALFNFAYEKAKQGYPWLEVPQ